MKKRQRKKNQKKKLTKDLIGTEGLPSINKVYESIYYPWVGNLLLLPPSTFLRLTYL